VTQGETDEALSRRQRSVTTTQTRARLAVPFVWVTATVVARSFDPWIPIAIAALGMSVTLLATDRVLMRRLFRPTLRMLMFGLVSAAVMVATTYALFPLLARAVPAIGDRTGELYATFLSGRPTVSVLLFVIPVIFAEEILWRGAFQEWVETRLPARPVMTVIFTAGVYAISHAPLGSGLLVAVAFVCGLYWSALRIFSRSLLPSLIVHLAWDLALILIPLHR
jgi:membrane protease YdiL (CAAX protease family)